MIAKQLTVTNVPCFRSVHSIHIPCKNAKRSVLSFHVSALVLPSFIPPRPRLLPLLRPPQDPGLPLQLLLPLTVLLSILPWPPGLSQARFILVLLLLLPPQDYCTDRPPRLSVPILQQLHRSCALNPRDHRPLISLAGSQCRPI